MKKKAVEKTIIQLLKIVGGIVGAYYAFMGTIYLLMAIPVWIVDVFGLYEKYEDYPFVYFLGIELIVILVLIVGIAGIRNLYKNNLENIREEEECKTISQAKN